MVDFSDLIACIKDIQDEVNTFWVPRISEPGQGFVSPSDQNIIKHIRALDSIVTTRVEGGRGTPLEEVESNSDKKINVLRVEYSAGPILSIYLNRAKLGFLFNIGGHVRKVTKEVVTASDALKYLWEEDFVATSEKSFLTILMYSYLVQQIMSREFERLGVLKTVLNAGYELIPIIGKFILFKNPEYTLNKFSGHLKEMSNKLNDAIDAYLTKEQEAQYKNAVEFLLSLKTGSLDSELEKFQELLQEETSPRDQKRIFEQLFKYDDLYQSCLRAQSVRCMKLSCPDKVTEIKFDDTVLVGKIEEFKEFYQAILSASSELIKTYPKHIKETIYANYDATVKEEIRNRVESVSHSNVDSFKESIDNCLEYIKGQEQAILELATQVNKAHMIGFFKDEIYETISIFVPTGLGELVNQREILSSAVIEKSASIYSNLYFDKIKSKMKTLHNKISKISEENNVLDECGDELKYLALEFNSIREKAYDINDFMNQYNISTEYKGKILRNIAARLKVVEGEWDTLDKSFTEKQDEENSRTGRNLAKALESADSTIKSIKLFLIELGKTKDIQYTEETKEKFYVQMMNAVNMKDVIEDFKKELLTHIQDAGEAADKFDMDVQDAKAKLEAYPDIDSDKKLTSALVALKEGVDDGLLDNKTKELIENITVNQESARLAIIKEYEGNRKNIANELNENKYQTNNMCLLLYLLESDASKFIPYAEFPDEGMHDDIFEHCLKILIPDREPNEVVEKERSEYLSAFKAAQSSEVPYIGPLVDLTSTVVSGLTSLLGFGPKFPVGDKEVLLEEVKKSIEELEKQRPLLLEEERKNSVRNQEDDLAEFEMSMLNERSEKLKALSSNIQNYEASLKIHGEAIYAKEQVSKTIEQMNGFVTKCEEYDKTLKGVVDELDTLRVQGQLKIKEAHHVVDEYTKKLLEVLDNASKTYLSRAENALTRAFRERQLDKSTTMLVYQRMVAKLKKSLENLHGKTVKEKESAHEDTNIAHLQAIVKSKHLGAAREFAIKQNIKRHYFHVLQENKENVKKDASEFEQLLTLDDFKGPYLYYLIDNVKSGESLSSIIEYAKLNNLQLKALEYISQNDTKSASKIYQKLIKNDSFADAHLSILLDAKPLKSSDAILYATRYKKEINLVRVLDEKLKIPGRARSLKNLRKYLSTQKEFTKAFTVIEKEKAKSEASYKA